MKVYQVIGIAGEFEDYCEWVVATYLSPQKATGHTRRANNFERLPSGRRRTADHRKCPNPHDPECRRDLGGVEYETRDFEIADPPKTMAAVLLEAAAWCAAKEDEADKATGVYDEYHPGMAEAFEAAADYLTELAKGA